MPHPSNQRRAAGFTLLEMLVSLALFLIISGVVLGGMTSLQKSYRGLEVRTAMEQRLRAALELMAQEINQAGLPAENVDLNGLVTAPLATSSSNISPGSSVTLNVSSTSGMYPNQQLWLDVGTAQEPVTISSIGTGTVTVASVQNTHNGSATAFPIFAMGVYANGVLPNSTSTKFEFFGDITAQGNPMVLVTYACPTTTPGALTRTVYPLTTTSQQYSSQAPLLDNVTACSFTTTNNTVTLPGFANPAVTTVSISVTIQSQTKDPQSNGYITITKSFLNIQPRSLNAAIGRYLNYGDTTTLMQNPTNGIFTNLP